MSPYQTADMDQQWRDEQEARVEYILDGATQCGASNPCIDFCPNYMHSIGMCRYGEEFPRCETGRILRNK